MKYSVVKCVNGSNEVIAEGMTLDGAKLKFWEQARILTNAVDVYTGELEILDEKLNTVTSEYGTYKEHIEHPQPEPQGE